MDDIFQRGSFNLLDSSECTACGSANLNEFICKSRNKVYEGDVRFGVRQGLAYIPAGPSSICKDALFARSLQDESL